MTTLIEQMRQKFDIVFQILLTRAKSNKFYIENVVLLNNRTASNLSFCDLLDSAVIV